MIKSKFVQNLFEIAVGRKRSAIPKGRSIATRLFNRYAFPKNGPSKYYITERIGTNDLLLPANHRLPWTFEKYPLYSRNLSRINGCIAAEAGAYSIIDIGANIGDSAFLIRESDPRSRIICVEGNPEYLPLLEENLKQLNGVTLIKCFVGQDSGDKYGKLVSDGRGTTFIEESASGNLIRYASLKDILAEAGVSKEVRLVKIDTDGFDCQIIKGNIETIKGFGAVLFFEYAPTWFPGGKDSQADIFRFLADNGYGYFIFYDGPGNYLISCTAADLEKIAPEMHFYFSCGVRFGDVVAFPAAEGRLYEETIKKEKAFYLDYFKDK